MVSITFTHTTIPICCECRAVSWVVLVFRLSAHHGSGYDRLEEMILCCEGEMRIDVRCMIGVVSIF